jgi:trans-2-enoyl-CoA reductase
MIATLDVEGCFEKVAVGVLIAIRTPLSRRETEEVVTSDLKAIGGAFWIHTVKLEEPE